MITVLGHADKQVFSGSYSGTIFTASYNCVVYIYTQNATGSLTARTSVGGYTRNIIYTRSGSFSVQTGAKLNVGDYITGSISGQFELIIIRYD
jgi:hypothetical protein